MIFWEMVALFQAPLWGGIGLALLAGPLGTLLVWQRLAFLGDSLAHASLLGVGVAVLLGVSLWPLLLGSSVVFALILKPLLNRHQAFSPESLLLVLSQGVMGIGVMCFALTSVAGVDLMAYLTGDFLTLSWHHVGLIWGVLGVCGLLCFFFWSPFLAAVVDPILAEADGVPVQWLQYGFLILTALSLVLLIQSTGVLFVSALLIFPTLTLHQWVSTPESMCLGASLLALGAVLSGFICSLLLNLPTGPLITVFLFGCFGVSRLALWVWHK